MIETDFRKWKFQAPLCFGIAARWIQYFRCTRYYCI